MLNLSLTPTSQTHTHDWHPITAFEVSGGKVVCQCGSVKVVMQKPKTEPQDYLCLDCDGIGYRFSRGTVITA